MAIVEEVPEALRGEVAAAVAWLDAKWSRSFKVSGVVDPELAERARGAVNFWRPKGLALSRRGPDDVSRRAQVAMLKLALFVAGWLTAFALLPFGWVALALLAFAAIAAPGIVEAHRAFQSEEA